MTHTPDMKARIDFNKVKNIKDIKLILEVLQITFDGLVPENMQHFVVQVSEQKSVINFAKVKNIKDVKLILESLRIVLNPDNIPEDMKHMLILYDANATVETL